MQYKLIVDKQSRLNPSTDRKIYILDIEELRTNGDISDELIISPNESYVMRRLSLSEYHVLTVLDEPIKEVIENPQIELFEGNNYIYLIDMTGNRFYAEYLIKNEFNDTFITKKEADAKIDVASQQVIISVNEKLTNYSTTEETSAIIKALSDAITLELKKKINDKDLTGASIALRINGDTSEAKINADKVNLMGFVTVENLKTPGKTIIDGSNITTGTISGRTISGGTITGTTVNGGTISGTKITNGNNFSVDKDGNMICNNGAFNGGTIELKANKSQPGIFTIYDPDTFGTTDGNEFSVYPYGMRLGCFNKSVSINFPDGGTSPLLKVVGRNYKETSITADKIETPTLTQTSLKSKKKNIKRLKTNALKLVKDADICEYNFKGEKKGTKKHIGLVIGEGYNCPTEVISEGGQGVEPYSLTSLLWKAVQELTVKVEQLEVVLNGKN